MYIDYNHDGEFDEFSELAFDAIDLTTTTITGDVTIPGDAMLGLTRMRVVMSYNAPQEACGDYNFGETEDYCVTIVEGTPSCDAPENLSSSAITETSATVEWDAALIAESYNVRYQPVGGGSWTTDNTTSTSYDVSGLEGCTQYEFQVESVCTGGELSGYSDSHEFLTICECFIPANLDTMNVTTSTAVVLWEAVDNAVDYDLRYKLLSSTNWTTLANLAATSINLNSLAECMDYEFQVASNCGNSESDYSESFNFKTGCLVSTKDLEAGVDELSIYPNPFNKQFAVEFELNTATALNIKLYSATGKELYRSNYNSLTAGSNLITLNELDQLSNGVYFVTLTTDQGTTIRKVIKQ